MTNDIYPILAIARDVQYKGHTFTFILVDHEEDGCYELYLRTKGYAMTMVSEMPYEIASAIPMDTIMEQYTNEDSSKMLIEMATREEYGDWSGFDWGSDNKGPDPEDILGAREEEDLFILRRKDTGEEIYADSLMEAINELQQMAERDPDGRNSMDRYEILKKSGTVTMVVDPQLIEN